MAVVRTVEFEGDGFIWCVEAHSKRALSGAELERAESSWNELVRALTEIWATSPHTVEQVQALASVVRGMAEMVGFHIGRPWQTAADTSPDTDEQ